MNVLQFWLIDSIVKASASMHGDDGARETNDSSRQPLFRAPDSDDDDGEDDDRTIRAQRRHDIESPPTPQHKAPRRNSGITENKSLASGSSSTLVEPSSMNLHSYPPERSTSVMSHTVNAQTSRTSSDSTPSLSPSSTFSSGSRKHKRRSPPPPIKRPPPQLSNGIHYTISVTPSPTLSRSTQRSISPYPASPSPPRSKPRQRLRSALSQGVSHVKVSKEPVEQAWDNWGDGDNWAEKVGEDEWTGRRMGVTKAVLDVWGSNTTGGAGVEV